MVHCFAMIWKSGEYSSADYYINKLEEANETEANNILHDVQEDYENHYLDAQEKSDIIECYTDMFNTNWWVSGVLFGTILFHQQVLKTANYCIFLSHQWLILSELIKFNKYPISIIHICLPVR